MQTQPQMPPSKPAKEVVGADCLFRRRNEIYKQLVEGTAIFEEKGATFPDNVLSVQELGFRHGLRWRCIGDLA
jgi:hypothetical protein